MSEVADSENRTSPQMPETPANSHGEEVSNEPTSQLVPKWPSRLTRVMVCLTWPLIWVGGLVTTYDAGMSVPDWPGTYGYNLLLYPISTWLFGPFDLFIEHGHRLLAALVGFIAIGLVIASLKTEKRRWAIGLSVMVLAAVIGQGVLGGLRVTLSARTLAMIHGCVGPAFFVLCVIAACVTGRKWLAASVRQSAEGTSERTPTAFWPISLLVLAYMQLVLGAMMRHALPGFSPVGFAHIVKTHITIAFVLWLTTGLAYWRMRRCGDLTLSRPAGALICFVAIQIGLGFATWIVNYGYPRMLASFSASDSYLLHSKNVLDAWIVTGHVATGSLILAVSSLLLVRLLRRRRVLSFSVSS
ncbi:COX15/CtaA family protein [Rhodopirellula europaea]|uniref:COX15/CtaA family protein n=1 Tax=Rhodopirellula europaea TaxID=1263866 RepID=UPI003D2C16E6|tara:strand:+ start:621 stop:1691 length:1071 start_codon:yes stop_codon:yes gene_type:complete